MLWCLLNAMWKIPSFWEKEDSFWTKVLVPVSRLYRFFANLKVNGVTPEKTHVPVVCVGNVVIGGAGKTPTVEFVCKTLVKSGKNPHILTGGYGGYLKNVVRVDPLHHYYLQVGDEALLSAMVAPTWVGKNRVKSAMAAELSGADVLVMDDGFQNNSIEKNFKILVVDSRQAFGNGHIFPAGPLREPVESGIKRSDIILIIGNKNLELEDKIRSVSSSISIFYANLHVINDIEPIGKKVIGFCGIGYPEKFRNTLIECDFEISDFIIFADHHPYTITEIQKLMKAAELVGAALVTTQKDYVKIPEVFRSRINVIKVELRSETQELENEILKAIDSCSK